MSQQAIKIGVMALADSLGNEYPGEETIETIADATGLPQSTASLGILRSAGSSLPIMRCCRRIS